MGRPWSPRPVYWPAGSFFCSYVQIIALTKNEFLCSPKSHISIFAHSSCTKIAATSGLSENISTPAIHCPLLLLLSASLTTFMFLYSSKMSRSKHSQFAHFQILPHFERACFALHQFEDFRLDWILLNCMRTPSNAGIKYYVRSSYLSMIQGMLRRLGEHPASERNGRRSSVPLVCPACLDSQVLCQRAPRHSIKRSIKI